MNAAVVDACVAVKWVMNEQFSQQAASLLDYDALHAPSHWRIEAVNAVWGYVFRGRLAAGDARERSEALMHANVIETDARLLLPNAFDISVLAGVTIYDALYVALASERSLPLMTADRRLISRLSHNPGVELRWVGDLAA